MRSDLRKLTSCRGERAALIRRHQLLVRVVVLIRAGYVVQPDRRLEHKHDIKTLVADVLHDPGYLFRLDHRTREWPHPASGSSHASVNSFCPPPWTPPLRRQLGLPPAFLYLTSDAPGRQYGSSTKVREFPHWQRTARLSFKWNRPNQRPKLASEQAWKRANSGENSASASA